MKINSPLELINKYIKDKDFLNVKDFLQFKRNILIFITYKGNGKSKSSINLAIEWMLQKDYEWAFVRNTEIEFQKSKVADSFIKALDEYDALDEYKVRTDGVYKVTGPNEKGILKGMFLTMNKPFNVSSQNALEKCKLIIYDEFINPTFHKKNLFSDFMKMVHTCIRKNNDAVILLLGNKHESDNDILNELGVEFDWSLNENQIIDRPEQSLLACYLTKWEIAKMSKANDLIEKISMYSPSMKNFAAGNLSNDNMVAVKNWYINNLEQCFDPYFRFDLNGTRYCVGKLINTPNTPTYIKQLDFNSDFETDTKTQRKLKTFCYHTIDKLPDNILLQEKDELDTIFHLLKEYSRGNLLFSTAYGKDEFVQLLKFLKIMT